MSSPDLQIFGFCFLFFTSYLFGLVRAGVKGCVLGCGKAGFCIFMLFGGSPLSHAAKRHDSSPAGGAKCTCVNHGKVCGKAKPQKVRFTTKFASVHGRALGSPSGRAGAKRLRGEQKARLPSPSCRFAPCHLSRTRERQNVTCRLLPPTFTGEVARRAGEGQNSEKSRTV